VIEAFRFAIEDTPLFCKTCQGIFLHTLKAREALRPGVPAPAQEPILIVCHHCRQAQIFVANEFRNYSPAPLEGTVYKIPGRSRLQVKDAVYLPGQPCPGIIKSRFRAGNLETFVITLASGIEIQWSQKGQQNYSENAQEGYRLIPFDLGNTRIGDLIFHTSREKRGRAIGLIFGKESKLAIQLEDETLLLITLEKNRQIPENQALIDLATASLATLGLLSTSTINIDAGQGILYARGSCLSLHVAQKIRACLNRVTLARGFVDLLDVKPTQVPDTQIIEQIMNLLLRKDLPIFGIQIECCDGFASVQGYCRKENSNNQAFRLLESITGLRNLRVDLKLRPSEDPTDELRIQSVVQALLRNNNLKNAKIRIYSQKGTIHLEGIVHSNLQRSAAHLAAAWADRNFKICNDISVQKTSEIVDPFIIVA